MIAEKNAESLHDIAVKVANNIHRMSDAEHGRAIDKYGKVTSFKGDSDGVYIDLNTDTRITVHNHPNEYHISSTFSYEDIYRLLSKKYLYEIIVCGYGYYYYLKRGSYNGLSIDLSDKVKSVYMRVRKRAIKEYTSKPENLTKSNRMKLKEIYILIEAMYHQKLLDLFCEEGLIYGKVKL